MEAIRHGKDWGFEKPSFSNGAAYGDLDNDGDLDLFNGERYNNARYFLRSGTATAPVFGSGTQFSTIVTQYFYPAFFDYDNDGDLDLFVGPTDYLGRILFFPNVGGVANTSCSPKNAALASYTNYPISQCPVPGYTDPLAGLGTAGPAGFTPISFVDIDNDGDKDLFVQRNIGYYPVIQYYKNTGTLGNPVFTLQTGAANPFNGYATYSGSALAFGDVDGDGDKDVLVGSYGYISNLNYLKNTGTLTNPVFTLQTGANDIFSGINISGEVAVPTFTNLDGDANLDLIIGISDRILYYEIMNGVLPIDWIDFSAIEKNNTVQLDWQVNAGVNATDYTIQHSTDGRNWLSIGHLNTAGHSSRSYQYTHNNPVNGTNYYRLLQNSVDGKTTQSEVRVVNFKGTIDQNFILVNSVAQNGVLNVHAYGNTELKLYNSQGQLLQTFTAKSGVQQLKLNTTAKGIYYLRSLNKTERFFIQ
jgi:hypothetical protein